MVPKKSNVACELKALNHGELHSWTENKSEIELLYVTEYLEIISIEVKSRRRTKGKSLKSYIDGYSLDSFIEIAKYL